MGIPRRTRRSPRAPDRRRAPRPARLAPLLAFATLLPLLPACRGAVSALGSSPAESAAHADQLLESLGARFGPHGRDARLDSVRQAFARAALSPGRLFADSALWTARSGDAREVFVAGAGEPGRYGLAVTNTLPALLHPGDYRRELRLAHLGGDDYEWTARDELAIGAVTGDDLSRALGALFAAAERGDTAAVRAAYRAELPRATAALAPLFSLDTLRIAPAPAGGADVALSMAIHPSGIDSALPHLARYLDKYAGPSAFSIVVADRDGRTWWRAVKERDHLSLAFRVHDGSLAPLSGGPAALMPDSLRVRIDATTKAWLFRVGMRRLDGDVALVRAPHEKAFVARFTTPPDWQLPPLVGLMLRAPLRRPFEGRGAMLSFSVGDGTGAGAAPGAGAGAQTVAAREYRLAVRESRIMRWFGGLGHSALDDFRHGAEEEFDRFAGYAFGALRSDAAALAGGAAGHK